MSEEQEEFLPAITCSYHSGAAREGDHCNKTINAKGESEEASISPGGEVT